MLWEHQEPRTPDEESGPSIAVSPLGESGLQLVLRSWGQRDRVTGLHAVKYGAKRDLKVVSKCESGIKPNKPKPDSSVLIIS